jgi:hypothetical protein
MAVPRKAEKRSALPRGAWTQERGMTDENSSPDHKVNQANGLMIVRTTSSFACGF